MTENQRERLLAHADKVCDSLRVLWSDACGIGDADTIRAADEAYNRAAALRDHLEDAA